MVNRVEGNQIHFLHIRLAVFGQIPFIAEYVHDFSYEVVACLTLVNFLLYTAFKRKPSVNPVL